MPKYPFKRGSEKCTILGENCPINCSHPKMLRKTVPQTDPEDDVSGTGEKLRVDINHATNVTFETPTDLRRFGRYRN